MTRTVAVESVRPKKFVPVGKPTPVPVICKGDDVTAEWLTLMFRFRQWLGPDGTVDEIKTKSIGEGQGEYGDLMAVEVVRATNAPDNLPKYMIAKMCPQRAAMPKMVLKGIYLNEAHFYNDFSIDGGALIRPECYHVAANLKAKWPQFCFMLEVGICLSDSCSQ